MPTQDEMWSFVQDREEVFTKDLMSEFEISWNKARYFLVGKVKAGLLGAKRKGGGQLDSKTTIFYVFPCR